MASVILYSSYKELIFICLVGLRMEEYSRLGATTNQSRSPTWRGWLRMSGMRLWRLVISTPAPWVFTMAPSGTVPGSQEDRPLSPPVLARIRSSWQIVSLARWCRPRQGDTWGTWCVSPRGQTVTCSWPGARTDTWCSGTVAWRRVSTKSRVRASEVGTSIFPLS